jgi:putative peptidoglycan lipid II flippase
MMNRALQFLSYEVRGLHIAVYILAFSALLSSLLALLRDRLMAEAFGASATLDLYYAAFRIPDLIFVAMGALVSVYVLIPELSKRSSEEQRSYIDTILIGFSVLAVVVSTIAAFAAPFFLGILFPQLNAGSGELVLLTRIMLLQPIFLGLSNILAAITQVRSRYGLYALSPLLYNLGIIVGVLFFYPLWGTAGLAVGVVLGAFLHFAIQLPTSYGDGFFHSMPRITQPKILLDTVFISIPRALALSMSQVSFLGLTSLAALLASGSIAVFMFAYNLQAVPLAIIGASYSVAAFPTLAAAMSRGDRDSFVAHIATAARHIFFWSLPITALILVLRAHIVRVILGSGAFDWTDTRLTAAAFALLAVSLVCQSLTLLLVRGYYAAGRTFVPFVVACGSAIGTIALGALLIGFFRNQWLVELSQDILRVAGVPGSSVLTLAFAYSLVAIVSTLILVAHFQYRFGGFLQSVWRSWGVSGLSALGGGAIAYFALSMLDPISLSSTTLTVFTRGLIGGMSGVMASVCIYWLLRSEEFSENVSAIRGRLWRTSIDARPGIAVVASAEEGSPAGPQ